MTPPNPLIPLSLYGCPRCPASFATPAQRLAHLEARHSEPPMPTSERLICRTCGLAVEGEAALVAHRDGHIQREQKRRARDQFAALLADARAEHERTEAMLRRLKALDEAREAGLQRKQGDS